MRFLDSFMVKAVYNSLYPLQYFEGADQPLVYFQPDEPEGKSIY